MTPEQRREHVALLPLGAEVEWIGSDGVIATGRIIALHGAPVASRVTIEVKTSRVKHVLPGSVAEVRIFSGPGSIRIRPLVPPALVVAPPGPVKVVAGRRVQYGEGAEPAPAVPAPA